MPKVDSPNMIGNAAEATPSEKSAFWTGRMTPGWTACAASSKAAALLAASTPMTPRAIAQVVLTTDLTVGRVVMSNSISY
jgi:hypothetical protein